MQSENNGRVSEQTRQTISMTGSSAQRSREKTGAVAQHSRTTVQTARNAQRSVQTAAQPPAQTHAGQAASPRMPAEQDSSYPVRQMRRNTASGEQRTAVRQPSGRAPQQPNSLRTADSRDPASHLPNASNQPPADGQSGTHTPAARPANRAAGGGMVSNSRGNGRNAYAGTGKSQGGGSHPHTGGNSPRSSDSHGNGNRQGAGGGGFGDGGQSGGTGGHAGRWMLLVLAALIALSVMSIVIALAVAHHRDSGGDTQSGNVSGSSDTGNPEGSDRADISGTTDSSGLTDNSTQDTADPNRETESSADSGITGDGSDIFVVDIPEFEFKAELSLYEEYMNPSDRDAYLILVNPDHPLAEDYVPADLVDVEDTRPDRSARQMVRCAEAALEAFLIEARANGISDVTVTSAYRSYNEQNYLFNTYTDRELAANAALTRAEAEKIVETYSCRPGTSEHQSGLCVDMHNMASASVEFGNTDAAKWMAENCWKFGYILRFPADKTEETGISYEPWHFRFVGRYHAARIHALGLCLEEYVEQYATGTVTLSAN